LLPPRDKDKMAGGKGQSASARLAVAVNRCDIMSVRSAIFAPVADIFFEFKEHYYHAHNQHFIRLYGQYMPVAIGGGRFS